MKWGLFKSLAAVAFKPRDSCRTPESGYPNADTQAKKASPEHHIEYNKRVGVLVLFNEKSPHFLQRKCLHPLAHPHRPQTHCIQMPMIYLVMTVMWTLLTLLFGSGDTTLFKRA